MKWKQILQVIAVVVAALIAGLKQLENEETTTHKGDLGV